MGKDQASRRWPRRENMFENRIAVIKLMSIYELTGRSSANLLVLINNVKRLDGATHHDENIVN